MTTIRVKENEPFDVALRRFKRTIEKLGLLTDLRAREFYEKPTQFFDGALEATQSDVERLVVFNTDGRHEGTVSKMCRQRRNGKIGPGPLNCGFPRL